MELPFEYNPVSRVKRTFLVDPCDPKSVAIKSEQNTLPIYELNQAIRNSGLDIRLPDWGYPVAEIPTEDYRQLAKEYPELIAKGKGARKYRQKAIRTILTTHPERFKWLWRDKF